MDQLDVKEVCSGESSSSSSEESLVSQRSEDDQKIVYFEDEKQKKKLKRTKRESRAEHAAKRERDRMGMVLPDPVQDRERERNFVHLATKGVVQLFNAVAERQKELKDVLTANATIKKRRLRDISTENFKKKLAVSKGTKNGVSGTKDWLSDDQVTTKSETEDDLETSGIKTEPESDSE